MVRRNGTVSQHGVRHFQFLLFSATIILHVIWNDEFLFLRIVAAYALLIRGATHTSLDACVARSGTSSHMTDIVRFAIKLVL